VVSEVVDVGAFDPHCGAGSPPRLVQVSPSQRSPGLTPEHRRPSKRRRHRGVAAPPR
jgi:hypothetical protein